jgi:pantetheine-phosphate adenylyltransferase
MRIAIYPGSFDPWHEGHNDVLKKALKTFDQVVIAVGINPEKHVSRTVVDELTLKFEGDSRVGVFGFSGLLVDFVKQHNFTAVVRGLRNGHDLEFERTQQYWNEDLGIKIPTVYFVTDRKLVHVSSSAIRAVEKAKNGR